MMKKCSTFPEPGKPVIIVVGTRLSTEDSSSTRVGEEDACLKLP
jgi:hypothetical protein